MSVEPTWPGRVRSGRRNPLLLPLIVVGVIALLLAGWGILSRYFADQSLAEKTEAQSLPSVRVAKPARQPAQEELVLPGTVQAFYETQIYARTNGYLKRWLVDIGAQVKEGQLLAEIDTPDVDAQFRQAKADLGTSEANNQLAQATAKRWVALRKTDSVSQQDTDEKVSAAAANAATVASSQANLARLQQLEDFKQVIAPFDGVITARTTDVGALISAGSSGPQSLFRIADTSKLRIYTQVPQNYLPSVSSGLPAKLNFAGIPGKSFEARLVRTSEALDPTGRSLLVELQTDNRDRQLVPGGYTEVHFQLPSATTTVRVPVGALIFRSSHVQVAVLGQDNRVQLKDVTIGRDLGTVVELTTGLDANDQVVLDPPDSLIDNEQVHVVAPPPPEQTANKPA